MDNLAMRLEKLAVEEGLEFSYNFFPGDKRRKEPAEHQVFLDDGDDAYLGAGATIIAALDAAEENYKKGEVFDFVDEDDDD